MRLCLCVCVNFQKTKKEERRGKKLEKNKEPNGREIVRPLCVASLTVRVGTFVGMFYRRMYMHIFILVFIFIFTVGISLMYVYQAGA